MAHYTNFGFQPTFASERRTVMPKMMYLVGGIMLLGVLITLLNVLQLRAMQREHFQSRHVDSNALSSADQHSSQNEVKPIVWVNAKNARSGYLDHVFAVFSRLGYAVGDGASRWSVLWHHDYPFLNDELKGKLHELQPHQKVNHIPGSGYYTSKVNLATSNITGIPPAFGLPKQRADFLRVAKANPKRLWVQKSNKHRGIRILPVDQLDLGQENSFVQEYISNPLLIDRRKFDVGIYTVVTSVSPLRVYVYEGDALLRFCPQDYHPFDPANLDKYVVGDDYTPIWKMASLSGYYTKMQYTWKESLNAYLRKQGRDPSVIWTRIRDTIRQVFHAKSHDIQPLIGNYRSNANFFELSRFDFVIDDQLNVYLMEANMSPNLSSGHFPPNKLLYEQVIMNLLSVVGVATSVHSHGTLRIDEEETANMLVSERDIQVYVDQCAASRCETCSTPVCKLCNRCLTPTLKQALKQAYAEHTNRRNMRRIIPRPTDRSLSDDTFKRQLAKIQTGSETEDRLMALWFRGKCLQDTTWCS